jgi:hypothetical protein
VIREPIEGKALKSVTTFDEFFDHTRIMRPNGMTTRVLNVPLSFRAIRAAFLHALSSGRSHCGRKAAEFRSAMAFLQ